MRHAEFWLVLVLAGLTFVVHDVRTCCAGRSGPTRPGRGQHAVPLSQLPGGTSSTPIAGRLLLRLFTVGGQQWLRLLPPLFACADRGRRVCVSARGLGWRDRRLGVLAGTLAPRPR